MTSRNAGGDASYEDDKTQSDVIALIDDDDTHSDAGSTDIDNGVGKCVTLYLSVLCGCQLTFSLVLFAPPSITVWMAHLPTCVTVFGGHRSGAG